MNFKCLQLLLKEDVVEFCMSRKIIDNHKACNHCRRPLKLTNNTRNADGVIWWCPGCAAYTSIRKNSLFYASHCSISTIIELLYWWTIKLPVTQASEECEVSDVTSIAYYKIFRGICLELSLGGEKIGGPGMIVEIDEMKLGKRKFNQGKRVEGQWCFGGVLRREDKDSPIQCFTVPVPDRSKNTLLPIIKDYIIDGTTIYSDCWKSYDCLEDEGFVHMNVNHSLHFKDPETGVHTNTMEGTWNQVRRSLPKFGTRKEYYHSYLAEFVIRNRLKGQNFFLYLLQNLHQIVKWE